MESEIGQFLRTRRDQINPVDVGLPPSVTRRRVTGLRREEVALLAGVSPDYYVRLEQGRTTGVSDQVLLAVAKALSLTDVEAEHLRNLAHPGALRLPSPDPSHDAETDEPLRRMLIAMADVPAILVDLRMDILAANAAAEAVFNVSGMPQPANSARELFLSAGTRSRYADWDGASRQMVAHLRLMSGRWPHDPRLTSLIGELAVHSHEFRKLWAAGDVREKRVGSVRLHHPVVGELEFDYQMLSVPARPDRTVLTYLPKPDSSTEQSLRILLSWESDSRLRVSQPQPPDRQRPTL